MKRYSKVYIVFLPFAKAFAVCLLLLCFNTILSGQPLWQNPIQKQGRLGSPLVESSPFVFKGKLFLLENNQRFWDVQGAKPGDFFHEDEVRIRDVESDQVISVPLKNHAFGTVLTWNNRVYIFAGDYGEGKPWRHISEISMTSSTDLKNWTKPITILKAKEDEFFYNTAVCRGEDRFVLLYETNDDKWKPFTFRYMESTDLENWKEIPDAIYGKKKYVGGPALYYENDWYYTLYLESLENGYETRITRSRDLITWEDAPSDRPFITFDPTHRDIPLIDPSISESNASDVELCYYNGKTIIYFTGSDQTTAGDLQWATYEGTPRQLFEHFFKETDEQSNKPPQHQGDWTPVLISPEDSTKYRSISAVDMRVKPTPQQLAYQERQLGAFIHFGPATYIESDMLSVPDADLFNPSRLNAEQWVKTARSFGAKHIVLTAKHHNGFCLWPTKTTDYSVKNSPWKNGDGDVVAEFVDACRKYDMKVGLYLSGGDKHFPCSSTPDPQGERKLVGDVDKYFPVYLEQLRELLTAYGEVSILWLDGAYDPFGWDVMDPETLEPLGTEYGDAIRSMVAHLQPNAVVMGGTKPDVRWSGSEQGWAAYPLWNIVEPGKELDNWVAPNNVGWIPAEANLHTRKSWFWTPDSDKSLRSIPFMKKVYFETIGRGANLLINMTPDTRGLIPEVEVERLTGFGKTLEQTFSSPVGSTGTVENSSGSELVINIPNKQRVNLLVIEEDIRHGQQVRQYKVDAFTDGQWTTIAEGETIGRKRIQTFEPIETTKIRLLVEGKEDKAFIQSFTVYRAE